MVFILWRGGEWRIWHVGVADFGFSHLGVGDLGDGKLKTEVGQEESTSWATRRRMAQVGRSERTDIWGMKRRKLRKQEDRS